MAILKSVLDEPLLSRQQAVVLRDIARAAQLSQGLKELQNIEDNLDPKQDDNVLRRSRYLDIQSYLSSEIKRILTQVKVPKLKPENSED